MKSTLPVHDMHKELKKQYQYATPNIKMIQKVLDDNRAFLEKQRARYLEEERRRKKEEEEQERLEQSLMNPMNRTSASNYGGSPQKKGGVGFLDQSMTSSPTKFGSPYKKQQTMGGDTSGYDT